MNKGTAVALFVLGVILAFALGIAFVFSDVGGWVDSIWAKRQNTTESVTGDEWRHGVGDPCVRVEPYLVKGDYRLAEGAAKSCLDKFPNHIRIWYFLSRALAGQKRWPEALKWVDKAIKLRPGNKDLHIWRIRLLAWSGDLDKAWNERYKIIKVAERSKDAAMLIGDVAFWRKDCVEAVKWYDYIAKRWPNSERAKANRDRCISDASIPPAADSSATDPGISSTADSGLVEASPDAGPPPSASEVGVNPETRAPDASLPPAPDAGSPDPDQTVEPDQEIEPAAPSQQPSTGQPEPDEED